MVDLRLIAESICLYITLEERYWIYDHFPKNCTLKTNILFICFDSTHDTDTTEQILRLLSWCISALFMVIV